MSDDQEDGDPFRHQASLPADRSFLLQFRACRRGERDGPSGRVEHVESGRSAHFENWAGIRRFVEETLRDPG
jgi:hypothetical protein